MGLGILRDFSRAAAQDRFVMQPVFVRFIAIFACAAFLAGTDVANARSLMDILKAIGNSIAHPQKKSHPPPRTTKSPAPKKASPTPSPAATVAPPGGQNVRRALRAPAAKGEKRDAPYGVPVPGRQGLVTSPFAPDAGYIDVSKFSPGTEVKDPFTGKVFRTP